MNISELKAVINHSIEDNILLLKGADLESTGVENTLSDFFPEDILKLEFMDGQTDIGDMQDKEGIALRGRGIEYPFLGAAMELELYIKEGQLQFNLQAAYDGKFVFTDAFLPFRGTLLEKIRFSKTDCPRICVSSESQSKGQCGMYFSGVVSLRETCDKLADFTGKNEIAVSGPIYLKEHGAGIYNFDFVADETLDINLGIAKPRTGLRLSTNLTYNSLEEGYAIIPYMELFTELQYESETAGKNDIPLSARIFDFDSDIRFKTDIDCPINLLTSDLEFFTNGVSIMELLPAENLHIEKLQLKKVFLDCDLRNGKPGWINVTAKGTGAWNIILGDAEKSFISPEIDMELSVEDPMDNKKTQILLRGEIAICENTVVVVEAEKQGKNMKAYIKEESAPTLKDILTTFKDEMVEVPEMKVRNFAYSMFDGKCTIQGDCYGYWPLYIRDKLQNLYDVAFTIVKEADKKSHLQLDGFITCSDKDICLSAIYADAGRGWIFEGSTLEGDGIQLHEAATMLFKPVGLDLAQGLPDFEIRNASLRFEEKGHSCYLSGECAGTWPLPAGNSVITADSLQVEIKYDNGKLAGAITGKAEFAGSRIDIAYDLTKPLVVCGGVTELDTGNFICQTCGGEKLELLPMPLGVDSMDFGRAGILLDVLNENIKIEGTGEKFQQSALIIKKSDEGFEPCFIAKVGDEWKFTSVSPDIGELDTMSFEKNIMAISGFQQERFESLEIEGDIVPGINFIARLKLDSAKKTSFLKGLLMLEEYLQVDCRISELGQAQISGELKPLLSLGDNMELQDSLFHMNVDGKGTTCSVSGYLKLKLFDDIIVDGDLSVFEKSVHYDGRMQEDWQTPYQLENVVISGLSVVMDMNESQIPNVIFGGNVRMGDACGKTALMYNEQNPFYSALNFTFETVGIKDILAICAPSLLTPENPKWNEVVCSRLKDADLFIKPQANDSSQVQSKIRIWGSGILDTQFVEIPVNIEISPEQQVAVYAQDWAYFIKNDSLRFSGNIGAACISLFDAGMEETIAAYKMEDREAKEAAVSIKEHYGPEADTAAQALRQGGYDAGQIAVGLTEAYQMAGENVAGILKHIGFSAAETAAAIRYAYYMTASTAARWLKNVGYTEKQTIHGLVEAYGVNAREGAECLKYAGYTSGEVAMSIKNAFNSTVDEISVVLRNAGYDAATVTSFARTAFGVKAILISSALRNAEYTGEEATGAIKFVYGWTDKVTAKLLRTVGYTAEQLSAGLKYYYRLNASKAAAVLRFAGYTAGQVLFGLKNVYLQSVEKSAAILKEAGYSANETAAGFKDSFNAEAVVTAVILKTVLYTVIEVACALKSVYCLSLEENAKVLRNAGYDSVLATEGLKAAYAVPENPIARSMRGAGFTAAEVALGLKRIYDSDAGTTAKALRYGGYTGEQTADALKGIYEAERQETAILLKGAGYTAVESAWGLKAAYAINVEMTAAALKGAGFGSEETACGIKAAYEITLNECAVVLKDIGLSGKETSAGLREAYDTLADETAGALWNAAYTAQETADGLKLVYAETDLSAASTLRASGYKSEEVAAGLRLTYVLSASRAASCMKEAGFTSEQTCFGLKEAYMLTSDNSLQALKEGGYSALQIALALKSIYGETAEKVSSLFRGIGFSAGQTGYSLRIVFGQTVVNASILLRKVGYTANETAAGLKTAFGSGVNVVAELLKSSGYPAEEVAYYIKNIYSETADGIAAALKYAAYSCREIAKGLRVACTQSADAAAATLSTAGYSCTEITGALMGSYEVSGEESAAALHQAGFNSVSVLKAVKEIYGASSQEAAIMLNKAEYFALEIAVALKEIYAATPSELTETFKNSGQTTDEIAYSLKDAYAMNDLATVPVIRAAGYSEEETARVVAIAYKLGPAEITLVLFNQGYTVLQAGSYLKNVGRYSGEVTNASLLGAKYNEPEVREFMKAGFGWYTPVEIPGIDLW